MTEDDFFTNFDGSSGSATPAPQKTPDPVPEEKKEERLPRLPMTREAIVTIVLLSVVAAFAVACVAIGLTIGADLDWVVWEYIIGVGGGVSLSFAVGVALFWLDKKDVLEFYCPVILLLIGASILNFVFRCYYADEEYLVIFVCIALLLTGLSVFFCFRMIDAFWIVTQAICTVFTIAFLISGWIMPAWGAWQWIIGGLVSLLFLAVIFVLERKGEFFCYSIALILTAILLAVNFVLMRKYAEDYKTIFIMLSASSMISSLISIALRHQKGDGAWGKVSIAPLVAGGILVLLAFVL